MSKRPTRGGGRATPGVERGERPASEARERPLMRTPVTAPTSVRQPRTRLRGGLGGRHRRDPGSRHIAGRGGGRRPRDRRSRRGNRRRSGRRRWWGRRWLGGACGCTRASRADRGGAMSAHDDGQRNRGPAHGGRSRAEDRARPEARFLHTGVDRVLELAQLYSPLTYDIARYRGYASFGFRLARTRTVRSGAGVAWLQGEVQHHRGSGTAGSAGRFDGQGEAITRAQT